MASGIALLLCRMTAYYYYFMPPTKNSKCNDNLHGTVSVQ